MVVQNRVSHELSQQKVDEIMTHLTAIQEALPFLIGLAPGERQRLLKAGDRSQAFVRKALDIGPMVHEHLPRSLDLDEMRKDVALGDALHPVMVAVAQLTEKLSDTYALVNSEAFAAALVIYRTAKSVKGDQGLNEAVASLRTRFGRRATRSSTEAANPGRGARSGAEAHRSTQG